MALGLRGPITTPMMGVVVAESLLQFKRCKESGGLRIFDAFHYIHQYRSYVSMETSCLNYFNFRLGHQGAGISVLNMQAKKANKIL